MKFQKSPFPYLFVLAGIILISCYTNLTIDKEIEEPIIHVIKKDSRKDIKNYNAQLSKESNTKSIAYK